MSRKFLAGISSSFVKDLDLPVLSGDATNKQYVDVRVPPVAGATGQVLTKVSATDYDMIWATPSNSGGPTTGTNINIDMGTFPEPINASIDAGGFT